MKSQTTYINKSSGFTLIEMLIVISIVIIIGSTGLFFGFDILRGYAFHSDRDVLVSALQHARAEAMANICRGDDCIDGRPHGVYIDTSNLKYIIFQTSSSACPTHSAQTAEDKKQDASIDSSATTTYESGSSTEVVFNQLSGEVCNTGDIVLKESTGRKSKISINSEGQIKWTDERI